MVSNGHVIYHPVKAKIRQRAVLLHNLGGGKFEEVGNSSGTYFSGDHLGRGLVAGDLNNDGWPDLAVCHANENASILQNTTKTLGKKPTFLGIELVGKNNADIVGSRVELTVEGKKPTRFAKGGEATFLVAIDASLLASRKMRLPNPLPSIGQTEPVKR